MAAHGAEQAHQSDEAQAPVDTEEIVSSRTVREMLKVQESILRALFEPVVKSLTARVDGVVESVNSLKASLEFSKRKYVDHQSMEAKIAKTEDSILKVERHLNNRTCPKGM